MLAAGMAAGLAGGTWGLIEAQAFILRRRTLALPAPPGRSTTNPPGSVDCSQSESPCLRILHLSDLHLLEGQRRKMAWVRSLADQHPDLIVLTGDSLAQSAAVAPLIRTLSVFAGLPGVFVFGSNDYFAPRPKNPFTYFWGPSSRSHKGASVELPWRDMRASFESFGWVDLNNRRTTLRIKGIDVGFVGVDDPHLNLDVFPTAQHTESDMSEARCRPEWRGVSRSQDMSGARGIQRARGESDVPTASDSSDAHAVLGTSSNLDSKHPRASEPPIKIGLAHAPYTRVLDAMADDECSLVFAGHTHGGQVCIPWKGAIVTNCDLPPQLAAGLYRWPASGEVVRHDGAAIATRPGPWVNVSAGLGASPFAPLRLACRPEAVLLDVILP